MKKYGGHIEGSRPDLLAKKITSCRNTKGWTVSELSRRTEIARTTIIDLEAGSIRNPSPEILARIAQNLDLHLADLYSFVGYAVPNELPDFDGYMAAKFRGLPNDAIEEIHGHLRYLEAKHGLAPNGPAPGEDEQ